MDKRLREVSDQCLQIHALSLFSAIERCESPIEQILGMTLNSLRYGYLDTHNFVISPQARIGPYRVDFKLTYKNGLNTRRVVVECDGHDFHERTKEQAQHEKERDRFLQSQGFIVLHFTGSDIWRDPFKCAEEAISILLSERGKENEQAAVHQH